MAEDKNEITRFRGDTYPIMVTIKENGIPIDLATAVCKMTIAFSDLEIVTIIGTNVSSSEGMARFDFTEEIADHVGKFFYDIQVESGGYRTTYAKNVVNFLRDVTPQP